MASMLPCDFASISQPCSSEFGKIESSSSASAAPAPCASARECDEPIGARGALEDMNRSFEHPFGSRHRRGAAALAAWF